MKETKTTPKVKLNIQPGQVTPAQKAAWSKFWQKLITEVKTNDQK